MADTTNMIDASVASTVTLAPNLPAQAMRYGMETKGALASKGQLYAGTGSNHTVVLNDMTGSSVTYTIADTVATAAVAADGSTNGYLLVANNAAASGWTLKNQLDVLQVNIGNGPFISIEGGSIVMDGHAVLQELQQEEFGLSVDRASVATINTSDISVTNSVALGSTGRLISNYNGTSYISLNGGVIGFSNNSSQYIKVNSAVCEINASSINAAQGNFTTSLTSPSINCSLLNITNDLACNSTATAKWATVFYDLSVGRSEKIGGLYPLLVNSQYTSMSDLPKHSAITTKIISSSGSSLPLHIEYGTFAVGSTDTIDFNQSFTYNPVVVVSLEGSSADSSASAVETTSISLTSMTVKTFAASGKNIHWIAIGV